MRDDGCYCVFMQRSVYILPHGMDSFEDVGTQCGLIPVAHTGDEVVGELLTAADASFQLQADKLAALKLPLDNVECMSGEVERLVRCKW